MPLPPPAVAALLRPGEAARAVPRYDRYWITDHGRVVSAVRAPLVMRPYENTTGHPQVEVWPTPGRGRRARMRRARVCDLVAEAFAGVGPHEHGGVEHANGDPRDNRLQNLRVAAVPDGGCPVGRKPPHATLDAAAVWAMRCQARAWGAEVAAALAVIEHGVTTRSARAAVAGRTWSWVPAAAPGTAVADLNSRWTFQVSDQRLAEDDPGTGVTG